MRRMLLIAAVVLLCAQTGQSAPAERSNILDGVRVRPLRFDPPKIATRALPGGAELLSVVDRDLPVVNLTLEFARGLDAEPVARAGMLGALARLLEIGGAGGRTGREFQEAVAAMGARISVDASQEYWSVSLRTLRDDTTRGLDLLEDLLLRPRLPDAELGVIKNGLLASIRQRNDQPSSIAGRKMQELLYAGRRRGYSLQTTDVNRLTVGEIRDEWRRRVTSRGLRVLLSGDWDQGHLSHIERLVAQLPREAAPEMPSKAHTSDPFRSSALREKIVLVRKEAVQSVLTVGALLPPHRHPDFFALQLCNQVLGGGSFNSRLMREIRVKRGLAYYAYSYNSFDGDEGRFSAGSATRVEATAETLRLLLDTIRSMQSGTEAKELHLARESILNSLVFQFEDPAAFLSSESRFRRHGLPSDYLEKFPARMQQTRDADVRRVARRLDPDSLFVVVVGPQRLKPALEAIRPVVVIDPEELPQR